MLGCGGTNQRGRHHGARSGGERRRLSNHSASYVSDSFCRDRSGASWYWKGSAKAREKRFSRSRTRGSTRRSKTHTATKPTTAMRVCRQTGVWRSRVPSSKNAAQAVDRDAHGLSHRRRFVELELHPVAASAVGEEQVEFRAVVRGPVICVGWAKRAQACSNAKPSHDAPTRGCPKSACRSGRFSRVCNKPLSRR